MLSYADSGIGFMDTIAWVIAYAMKHKTNDRWQSDVKIVGLLRWCGLWKCALCFRHCAAVFDLGLLDLGRKLNNTDYAAKLNLNTIGS